MTAIGRKPVGEVIVDVSPSPSPASQTQPNPPSPSSDPRLAPQFLDGGSYLKQKLELHVLAIEERSIRSSQSEAQAIVSGAKGREVPVGDEDVKRLMEEFSLDRGEATRVLREAGGKLTDAIWRVIDA